MEAAPPPYRDMGAFPLTGIAVGAALTAPRVVTMTATSPRRAAPFRIPAAASLGHTPLRAAVAANANRRTICCLVIILRSFLSLSLTSTDGNDQPGDLSRYRLQRVVVSRPLQFLLPVFLRSLLLLPDLGFRLRLMSSKYQRAFLMTKSTTGFGSFGESGKCPSPALTITVIFPPSS